MNNFEDMGIWFLPENPHKEISGKLNFLPHDKIQLDLVGDFQEIYNLTEKLEHSIEYPVINGYLMAKSEKVTLCYCRQKRQFKTGIQSSIIYPRYIIKGYHFSALEDIKFNCMFVHYKKLEEWINLPNVKISYTTQPENKDLAVEINITQKVKKPIEIGKINEFSVYILDKPYCDPQQFQWFKLFGVDTKKMVLEERKEIALKSDTPKSLKDFIETIYTFQEFLTLACGQFISSDSVKSILLEKTTEPEPIEALMQMNDIKRQLKQGKTEITASPLTQKEVDKPVGIQILFMQEGIDDFASSNKFLFRFTDIQNNSNEVLDSWFQSIKELKPIFEIYLRFHYIPQRTMNEIFLSLAQAIEGFAKIEYGMKRDLRTIVKELLDKTEIYHCFPDNFFDEESKTDFIRNFCNLRDNMTHHTEKSVMFIEKNFSSLKIKELTQKSIVILEVCLLQKLKISQSRIKSIMQEKIS